MIIVLAWVPLIVLSFIENTLWGTSVSLPLMQDPVPHIRLLVAIPLLLLGETIISRRLSTILGHLQRGRIITESSRPEFVAISSRLCRDFGRPAVTIVLLLVAIIITIGTVLSGYEISFSGWPVSSNDGSAVLTPAGWWYLLTAVPLFAFLMIRRIWHILAWCRFLWGLSRLNLDPNPIHPDRSGGLSGLGRGQLNFVWPLMAASSVASAALALELKLGLPEAKDVIVPIVGLVLIALFITVTPMLLFVGRLSRARLQGLDQHGTLSENLFGAFQNKWVGKSTAEEERLLGNTDPSSLSDYGYCFEIVQEMQIVPITKRTVVTIALATLLPFSPLLLVAYSLKDLITRVVGLLS
jgi:hypothetical protein